MLRPFFICATVTLCLNATLAHAQRGRESARPNNSERERQGSSNERSSAPGGEWGERTHSGSQSNSQFNQRNEAGAESANQNRGNQPNAAEGAAAEKNRQPQASGAQGAAAGAA